MSVTAARREHDADVQRRWLASAGTEQRWLPSRDVFQHRWRRFAQCGPWKEASDPETFFPLTADSDVTYTAREVCVRCPVRELCDAEATRNGYAGVWGGIHRDNTGKPTPLCDTPYCMRYRQFGKRFCRSCFKVIHAEQEAAKDPAKVAASKKGTAREVVAA